MFHFVQHTLKRGIYELQDITVVRLDWSYARGRSNGTHLQGSVGLVKHAPEILSRHAIVCRRVAYRTSKR